MLATIPKGQFIGSTIEHVFFLLVGLYLVFLWPRHVERQVASAKITREQAEAKLKQVRPWIGWFMIAWSIYGFVDDCYLYFWWKSPGV